MAENAELRRDLMRAQRTSLQLLDTQKGSTERIRELQDSNYGLQEEVANMRAQLAFATGNIINEIQDKVDAATFAGSTVRALKQQITEQTETIEKLKIQKRKAVTELSQVKLQMKKKKTSSKSTKSEKKKKSGKHSASSDANAAVAPSLIPAPGQAPSLVPSAQALVEKELVEDVMRDRVIRDAHLTSGVEVQLQEALLKANVGRNLRGFLDRGKTGCYYCFHEVCEKGPDASVELHLADPGCQLRGDKCNFRIKAVGIGSHRKVQIYNPAVVTLYGC
ncbi:hypothetical protein FNAPI_12699 [Fusarium napiforme]|uniref:Uncharacterized protein n=1 Tax=Fusarium napiforme TaxID=42672 RepID=A0A8H5IC93_9HYPO|nr:hypothetical protein FNAPI_12699 [Fusarium napiforme]